jgi:hypothetical protein
LKQDGPGPEQFDGGTKFHGGIFDMHEASIHVPAGPRGKQDLQALPAKALHGRGIDHDIRTTPVDERRRQHASRPQIQVGGQPQCLQPNLILGVIRQRILQKPNSKVMNGRRCPQGFITA